MTTLAISGALLQKPKLRGVFHAIGALGAVPAVVLAVAHAEPGRPATAALVYGVSLVFLLSASAIYHTPQWTHRTRMWLRRVDHTAIFILIAGSYTPMCLLVLPPDKGQQLLFCVWSCATAGAIFSLAWPTCPRWINVILMVTMGWMIVPFGRELLISLDATTLTLLLVGGACYSLGALAYARRFPDPFPRIFGYHEVFHVLVLAAVVCHFAAFWRVIG